MGEAWELALPLPHPEGLWVMRGEADVHMLLVAESVLLGQ